MPSDDSLEESLSDLKSYERRLKGREFRSRRMLKTEPLIRPNLKRRLLYSAGVFVPVGLLLGVIDWFVAAWYHSALITTLVYSVLLMVVGGGTWLTTVAGVNSGLRCLSEGIEVYQAGLVGDRVLRYIVPWEDLLGAEAFGGTGLGGVYLRTKHLPLFIDARQARAVLTDVRCPLRQRLTDGVLARIASPST